MNVSVHARASELLRVGLTPHRASRRLRREFPTEEKLTIDTAVGLGATGRYPLWAYHGSLRPVICRRDPRKG